MEEFKLSERGKEVPVSIVPITTEEKMRGNFEDLDDKINEEVEEEKASEKHVVNDGPEDVPPQPQREEINS